VLKYLQRSGILKTGSLHSLSPQLISDLQKKLWNRILTFAHEAEFAAAFSIWIHDNLLTMAALIPD
jgi:hypothetical protein